MARSVLTGSRIRERRLGSGLRQSELARRVGISPAYLNLIEHNRRRIGGKLLIDLAAELDVDPTLLSQGAQVVLLEALSDAAMSYPESGAELDATQEFAGRFPGWAAVVAAQFRRTTTLEQTVRALSDRLAHDPLLAASLHEVLSVVTAIRSTSAILTGDDPVDPEWQARFHRNIYEDSRRLAESAQALVAYLDGAEQGAEPASSNLPQEELENWLDGRGYYLEELENPDHADLDAVISNEPRFSAAPTTARFARAFLEQYRQDVRAVPMAALERALGDEAPDPLALAARFDCDIATVLRRLASMPPAPGREPPGLVCCDGSGTLTFRKPVDGFAMPQFGAACPLWPLFQALSRPSQLLRQPIEQAGHRPRRFMAFAIAQPVPRPDFALPQLFNATMLVLPDPGDGLGESTGDPAHNSALGVGTSCRLCPRDGCIARREPSILTEGF